MYQYVVLDTLICPNMIITIKCDDGSIMKFYFMTKYKFWFLHDTFPPFKLNITIKLNYQIPMV